MDKLVAKVRQELASLRKVAHHLHTPIDTSRLEKAVDELAAAATARRGRVKAPEIPQAKVDGLVADLAPDAKDDDK